MLSIGWRVMFLIHPIPIIVCGSWPHIIELLVFGQSLKISFVPFVVISLGIFIEY